MVFSLYFLPYFVFYVVELYQPKDQTIQLNNEIRIPNTPYCCCPYVQINFLGKTYKLQKKILKNIAIDSKSDKIFAKIAKFPKRHI